jgi:hypothetical protein
LFTYTFHQLGIGTASAWKRSAHRRLRLPAAERSAGRWIRSSGNPSKSWVTSNEIRVGCDVTVRLNARIQEFGSAATSRESISRIE